VMEESVHGILERSACIAMRRAVQMRHSNVGTSRQAVWHCTTNSRGKTNRCKGRGGTRGRPKKFGTSLKRGRTVLAKLN
jgi:hypothetical protein